MKPQIDLFIGSTNQSKINGWKRSLEFVKITTPLDNNLDLEIWEGAESLRENAERKAVEWAKKSNMLTLADDTGFYIECLDGKPGVSVKKWGGAFEREMTNGELLQYVHKELEGKDNTRAYFETVYAISRPDGSSYSFSQKYPGYIDLQRIDAAYSAGYPLGAIFVEQSSGKTWMEMTEQDQYEYNQILSKNIEKVVRFMCEE
jgi:XTP/dITP diphosphohydrolase